MSAKTKPKPKAKAKVKAKPKAKVQAKPKPKAKPVKTEVAVPQPQDFLAAIKYRTDGWPSKYMWACYGPDAIFVDADIPYTVGSASMVVDLRTNQICEMNACDCSMTPENEAYIWRNPKYAAALAAESRKRGVSLKIAWDKTKWTHVSPSTVFKRARNLIEVGERRAKLVEADFTKKAKTT